MCNVNVSLIVPIFNAEKYLRKCLNSILEQNYKNFEIILVDDGSTDRSGEICDEYALVNPQIRVIHKSNKGLVEARITGIENASGMWITFVDADDWIEANFLCALVNSMLQTEADITIAGYTRERDEESVAILNNIESGIYSERDLTEVIYPKMLCFKKFFEFGILPYIWNKIYKKDILAECYKEMDVSIYDGEDAAIVFPYLLKVKKIAIIEDTSYHYFIHKDSMTGTKKEDYYHNVSKLYMHLYAAVLKSQYYHVLLPQLDQYMRKMIWQVSPQSFPFSQTQEHLFPFNKIPHNARIILYGAGNVGKIYSRQIRKTSYCEIAAWVDREYHKPEFQKLGIADPEILKFEKYDFVVIAIASDAIVQAVRETLIRMGISSQKIVS